MSGGRWETHGRLKGHLPPRLFSAKQEGGLGPSYVVSTRHEELPHSYGNPLARSRAAPPRRLISTSWVLPAVSSARTSCASSDLQCTGQNQPSRIRPDNAARVLAVGLEWHCLERVPDVPGFEQFDCQSRVPRARTQPLRHRSGFKPDRGHRKSLVPGFCRFRWVSSVGGKTLSTIPAFRLPVRFHP
jgi:hypothetical protein